MPTGFCSIFTCGSRHDRGENEYKLTVFYPEQNGINYSPACTCEYQFVVNADGTLTIDGTRYTPWVMQ